MSDDPNDDTHQETLDQIERFRNRQASIDGATHDIRVRLIQFHALVHAGGATAVLSFLGTSLGQINTIVLWAALPSLGFFIAGLTMLSFAFSKLIILQTLQNSRLDALISGLDESSYEALSSGLDQDSLVPIRDRFQEQAKTYRFLESGSAWALRLGLAFGFTAISLIALTKSID